MAILATRKLHFMANLLQRKHTDKAWNILAELPTIVFVLSAGSS